MELPAWFGKDEFYAILNIIYVFISVYLIATVLRFISEYHKLNVKPKPIAFIKQWWSKRKEKKYM